MADASVRLGLDPSGPLAGWERRVVALPPEAWAAIDEIAGHYADLSGPTDRAAALAAGVGAEWVLALYYGDSDRIKAALEAPLNQAAVSLHAASALRGDLSRG